MLHCNTPPSAAARSFTCAARSCWTPKDAAFLLCTPSVRWVLLDRALLTHRATQMLSLAAALHAWLHIQRQSLVKALQYIQTNMVRGSHIGSLPSKAGDCIEGEEQIRWLPLAAQLIAWSRH